MDRSVSFGALRINHANFIKNRNQIPAKLIEEASSYFTDAIQKLDNEKIDIVVNTDKRKTIRCHLAVKDSKKHVKDSFGKSVRYDVYPDKMPCKIIGEILWRAQHYLGIDLGFPKINL